MIIFWIVVLAVAVYLLKDRISVDTGKRTDMNALELLKIRYAKGEIDEETFQRMKKEL